MQRHVIKEILMMREDTSYTKSNYKCIKIYFRIV